MLKTRSLISTISICISLSTAIFLSNEAFAFIPFLDEDTKPNTLEVGLTGGFFRLSPDFRVYGTNRIISGASSGFDNTVLKINPKYRWGNGIDVVYGSSYKLNVIYFEAENKKTQVNTGTIGLTLTPPSFGTRAAVVSSSLNSRYQFATISVSNPFTLNCFTATPSVGLSYLFLRHNQSASYSTLDDILDALVNLNSNFRGIGPTFAANFGYEFCGGFSVLGNLQYSPIVGDIRGNYSAVSSTPLVGPNTNVNLAYKTQSTIVSHTQSELGFGYALPINKCFSGNITLVYRFVKIIGARETNLFVDDVSNSLINNQITNSVLHGPLLRVALKYKL